MTQKTFKLLDQLSVFDIKRGSKLSVGLDFLRAIATLEVLISHLRNLYFVDYNQITITSNLFVKLLYFLTGFAHEAVIAFFVLSGLLIGNSVFKKLQQHRFTWKSYLIDRLSRLWIVLIPALLLGLSWDLAGNALSGGESIVYAGRLGTNIITEPVVNSISPSILMGNLFFLQNILMANIFSLENIYIPTLGSNGALWSLSHEFWYYMTLPVMIMAVINYRKIKIFLIYIAVLLVLFFVINLKNDQGLLVWLIGSFISLFPKKINLSKKHQSLFLQLAWSLVSVTLIATRLNFINSYADLILGLVFSVLLLVMSFHQGEVNENIISRISLWFSDFSYTIYLTHLPFLVFILSIVIKESRWQPDTLHIFYGFGLVLITVFFARIVYFLTEKNTPYLRSYLYDVF